MANWDDVNDLLGQIVGHRLPEPTDAGRQSIAEFGVLGLMERHPHEAIAFLVAFRDAVLAAHALRTSLLPHNGEPDGEMGSRDINESDVDLGKIAVAARMYDRLGEDVINTEFRYLAEHCACWPFPNPTG